MTESLTFKHLKNDLPAGLVVFLVALPLCLGIALASGAPLFAGIIAGIVGGTLVASLSGSSLSVSGPAAGLTVIVLNAIGTLGSFDTFLMAVVIAGLLQVMLGYLRAGIIGYYFPSSVIKGMLAAIGIILIIKQFSYAVGYDLANPELGLAASNGSGFGASLLQYLNHMHPGALIIASVSIAILIAWEQPFVKRIALFKILPGALFAVIAGMLLNAYFQYNLPAYYLSGKQLVTLPVSHSSQDFVGQFHLPNFSALGNYQVYVVAVTIAIIASLETLLSVEACDKLDPYKRITPTNRELKAQGVGNIVSGLLGGLPMTAVIVRSSANVNAGGRTKLSAIFHGVLLLVCVVGIAPLLNTIPLACLAALLLVVGYKLAKISLFKTMYKLGWEQFLPFLITIVAIQFSDLLKGIGIGMAVAIFFILRNNFKRAYFLEKAPHHAGEKIIIKLAEDITFLNKGSIARSLSNLPENSIVTIDGSGSHTIDLDVVEIIQDFKNTANLKNIQLELIGIPAFSGVSGH